MLLKPPKIFPKKSKMNLGRIAFKSGMVLIKAGSRTNSLFLFIIDCCSLILYKSVNETIGDMVIPVIAPEINLLLVILKTLHLT